MVGKSTSAPPPFSHELRVRYGECDAQGIVFNANFLAYVDVVLTEIWRQSMGSYDVLRLAAGFAGLGTTSTTLKLWFRRDAELLVEADIRYVFVDLENWQKAEIPAAVRAGLEPLLLR
jgi:acyl-CoA thioester hydrolase